VRALFDEYRLVTQLASESDILRAIDQYYGFELSIDGILHEIEPGEMEHQNLQQGVNEFSQPVVRLIDALLTEAVQLGASDIHFEPESSFLRIRYRVDGVLRQMRSLHKSFWPAMVVRLKVMSGMNIAETRARREFTAPVWPTGDFGLHLAQRHMAKIWYCNWIVKGIVPLDQIGLDGATLNMLMMIIAKPEGIVLVPARLVAANHRTVFRVESSIPAVNIMTLEDRWNIRWHHSPNFN
jgi:hypothetical protein